MLPRIAKFSALLLAYCFSAGKIHAQGCSDAGLCSFGSLNLLQTRYVSIPYDQVKLSTVDVNDVDLYGNVVKDSTHTGNGNSVQITQGHVMDSTSTSVLASYEFTSYIGIGAEDNTLVSVNQLETNFRLSKRWFAQAKLPYYVVNGTLGTTNGLGDVTLDMSYIPYNNGKMSCSFSAGLKLPSNNASLTMSDGRPYPMVYQTSLGSTDILVGARFTYHTWDVTIGYQHSFDATQNRYLHDHLSADSTAYNSYFESNGLKRNDDAVFRLNKKFNVKKMMFSAGLLCIYHMQDDHITNVLGERIIATGSKGVTLNLNVAGSIPLCSNTQLTFVLAKPVKQRVYVDDGLARKFVGIVGICRNF